MRGPFDASSRGGSPILVLSGLDGSGKSTQAELLARKLRESGVPAEAVWNRWEPRLTAPLIRLAKRTLRSPGSVEGGGYEAFRDAKRRTMRSGLKRGLWQAMAWSEYACQVHRRLLPRRLRGTAVVCDRYVYDTMIDIAINFSAPPERLGELARHPLLSLFPKPALVIFIDIDPAVGAARKSDGTPAAYLADRREYYREMARILQAPVLDGGAPVERVFAQVWELCAPWRAARGAR